MLKWTRPRLTDLSVRYTEAGGLGGASDGVVYQVGLFIKHGTSGPALPNPPFVPL
jgi:hypothetical protein